MQQVSAALTQAEVWFLISLSSQLHCACLHIHSDVVSVGVAGGDGTQYSIFS